MSYLDRLKASLGQKHPHEELTELTKAPSVSFVSSGGGHFQGWEAKLDELTERAGMLIGNNVPKEQADGLALLMLSLPFNPVLTDAERDEAEAALCWVLDHWNQEAAHGGV